MAVENRKRLVVNSVRSPQNAFGLQLLKKAIHHVRLRVFVRLQGPRWQEGEAFCEGIV